MNTAQFGFGIALLILGVRSQWSGVIVLFCLLLGVVGTIDGMRQKRKAPAGEPR